VRRPPVRRIKGGDDVEGLSFVLFYTLDTINNQSMTFKPPRVVSSVTETDYDNQSCSQIFLVHCSIPQFFFGINDQME
jgi:hypothetical protein